MGIQISWDTILPNTVHYTFKDRWTTAQYLEVFEQELRMVSHLQGERYDVIADLLESASMLGGSGLNHLYGTFKRTPPNMGLLAVVTTNPIFRLLDGVISSLFPDMHQSYRIVPSLDAAREMIQAARARELEREKPTGT
jgi:hypothetical protein